ncbi:hypothetical protein ES705_42568 [subsurface metagenome]
MAIIGYIPGQRQGGISSLVVHGESLAEGLEFLLLRGAHGNACLFQPLSLYLQALHQEELLGDLLPVEDRIR